MSAIVMGARVVLLLPPAGDRGLLVSTAATILGLTPRTVQRHLAALERAGLARRKSRRPGDEPDRWWRL